VSEPLQKAFPYLERYFQQSPDGFEPLSNVLGSEPAKPSSVSNRVDSGSGPKHKRPPATAKKGQTSKRRRTEATTGAAVSTVEPVIAGPSSSSEAQPFVQVGSGGEALPIGEPVEAETGDNSNEQLGSGRDS
jgi:hypothetical protein